MPREAYGKAGTWIRSITEKIRRRPKKGGILSVGGVKMYRLLKPNGGLFKNQARERPSERQSERAESSGASWATTGSATS